MSMMIGWCLHRYETDESVPFRKHWNAADEERAARLQAWGVPMFALLVLLGLPLGDSQHVNVKAFHQWVNDEKRILGMVHGLGEVKGFGCEQQWGPSQAEAFDSVGSNTGVLYSSTEAPYRLQENVLGPLGVPYVSGGIKDFEPAHQGSPPQEERSRRKRPREAEEDTWEDIQGLGVFDNFGHRERRKRIRGEGSSSTDKSSKEMKEMHAIDKKIREILKDPKLHAIKEAYEMLEDSDSDPEASVTSESSLEA
ncbi:hypothetical protein FPCIR_6172 [Fusarium pseudocircinatum]|uniref:Uncharacterized protein n=1 Tax=Fusarium pseudocircinatum TaxID=56676 RepID=A0A8H5UM35_9HYPO|nr:hypothetical protein FPCIR_6172 [Fusarium pseudocircinatum]